MAFAFGDSYFKLPPITNSESSVEIDGENSKRGSAGIVRDKHGLVRLPPIVRLDSLRSASSASRLSKDTKTPTTAESDSELSMLGAPLKISHKMESLRYGSANKRKKYTTEKREDETKLIKERTVMKTNEDDARLFDGENSSRGKQKETRVRLETNSLLNEPDDEDFTPLYKDSMIRRRGSSTFQTLGKLTRSHRLAKSSPELSNRKINSRMRADGTVKSSLPAGLRPSSRSRFSKPRISIHDIDGSVLSHLQNTSRIEEKPSVHFRRRHRSNQRWINDEANQPQSTPSSPVCSESANKEIKHEGRKSLNDITDTQQFADRRRPSLAPKRQSFIQGSEVLKIEGKSCPQSERETQRERAPTECHIDTLHPPQQGEKRHSLYDLQQILTLLQEENLKRKTPSTASTPRNTSASSNTSGDKNLNASVYDLREFLKLAAAEASNSTAGQQKKKTKASSHLLPPGQERENPRTERKGSVYDLMEFLSLGNVGETESGSVSENTSRAASPRIMLSSHGVSGSNDLLSVVRNAEEGRRSSTYNLMEFLSLPRSGGSSCSDSGPSSPALQGVEPTWPSGIENEESEIERHKKENRSLSVYDLAEFLNMTSSIPPLVRVTPSTEELTETGNGTESGGAAKKDFHKPRESVYDLREILSVFQQEHEKKRESTYNLQEILSYYQREADEASQLASATAKSPKKDTSPSPPMTASSGYSTASDSAPSASAKNLDANSSNRQMSVYDLREFLSLYAAQQSQPNQQQLPAAMLRRKFSGVSQSGVSIHVTDESNRSIDSDVFEDVFLPVPGAEAGVPDTSSKRSSIYDLREFLTLLNADDSPLRRRLSSVSSASSKSSESESESIAANAKSAESRPQLSPRQDSGGNVSLYDLGEFLSLLNTDESPLRRRLSSASDVISAQGDSGARTPVLSRSDSEKALYNLQEILTVINELEQKRNNENASGELETVTGEGISIQVPTLYPKTDNINAEPLSPKKLLQPQQSLNSVPETSEEKTKLSNSI